MPALLEDPTSPTIYRQSGVGPFPTASNPQIPSSIFPKTVTLRDRVTIATLIPFFSPDSVPPRLLAFLSECFNREIEDGNTYPMLNPVPLETFGPYWFGSFGAVMIQGDIGGIEQTSEMERVGTDWSKICLGSFYVKPNYPGRSSHVCNGGFLVTPAARNKGVGKSMGQCYLDWAPQLNYTYSVFNLVYESNTASTKIWDSLGFKRIGRVPGCGNLRSLSEPVDAIIYGRDLNAEEGSIGNEERFDKIRYYLRHSLYPQGADRSEKSRLRSAATHYKLIPAEPDEGVPEKLMLKDKEVISDPQAQYDIANQIHLISHGGINKTTAVIATKYHWVRIKETVSHVIKNCPECKDTNKAPILRGDGTRSARSKTLEGQTNPPDLPPLPPTPIKQEEAVQEPHPQSTSEDEQSILQPPPQLVDEESNDHDLLPSNHIAHRELPRSLTTNLQSDRMSINIPHEQLRDEEPNGHSLPPNTHITHRELPRSLSANIQSDRMSINIPHEQLQEEEFKPDQTDNFAEHISPADHRAIQEQIGALYADNGMPHDALGPDAEMINYEELAIDPQLMQQLQDMDPSQFQTDPFNMPPPNHHQMQHFDPTQRPTLLPHQGIHSDPGPPQFSDQSQLQQPQPFDPRPFSQHQSPTDFSQPNSQYISPVQAPHHMLAHPVPDDQMMAGGLDDGGGNGLNMQQIRHVMSMEGLNTQDNPNHYQQQRQ